MSTPNDPTPDGGPRFGQRSPGWKPEDPSATQPGQTSGTPWPQYGQTSGSTPSGSPWPQAGTTGAPSGPQGGAQYPTGPGYGAQPPYQQGPGVPSGPYGPGPSAPLQPLPSRAWAIVLVVVGALTATVLAFGVFLAVLLSGAGFQDLVANAASVTSGSTVTVDQSGSYLVSATGGESISCTLEGSDGTTHALDEATGNSSVVLGMGIPAGRYTLDCTGEGTGQMVGMTGVDASALTAAGARSLVWGTVVGVIGVVLTIVGVVWLVRVNRRRREIQRGQWNMGPYRA